MSKLREKIGKTLGNFNENELNRMDRLIIDLETKKSILSGFANRSSNFEEAFDAIYGPNGALEKLKQGFELEKTDNIY